MLVLVCCLMLCVDANTETKLLNALYKVESNSGQQLVGDNGKAIGPYQIWRTYWQDAIDFDSTIGGRYEDCMDKQYAERVIRAYWARYATSKRLGHEPTPEDLARIHKGGPNGYRNINTIKYWAKVTNALKGAN